MTRTLRSSRGTPLLRASLRPSRGTSRLGASHGRVAAPIARGSLRAAHGQASVEVAALLPLVAVIAAAAFHVLVAGAASEAAGQAAEAGAIALLQDRDPRTAARLTLHGWPRDSIAVRVRSRRITVTVRPRGVLPPLAHHLTARATADAGPSTPGTPHPLHELRGGDGAPLP